MIKKIDVNERLTLPQIEELFNNIKEVVSHHNTTFDGTNFHPNIAMNYIPIIKMEKFINKKFSKYEKDIEMSNIKDIDSKLFISFNIDITNIGIVHISLIIQFPIPARISELNRLLNVFYKHNIFLYLDNDSFIVHGLDGTDMDFPYFIHINIVHDRFDLFVNALSEYFDKMEI